MAVKKRRASKPHASKKQKKPARAVRKAAPVSKHDDVAEIIERLGSDVRRLSGKTILLTGGAGFLGRHITAVVKRLNQGILSKPITLISVDNFITGDPRAHRNGSDPNILQVWADVAHPLPIREDVDFIMHAAGVASPVHYMRHPIETIESAVHGTKNLLELARKNPKLEGFLFFSSSEIYGDPSHDAVPTPETYHGYVSSVGPRACYDESKRLGETLATIYHDRFGVPAKIVRPFNVFGPGMGHDDRRAIAAFAYEALNGRPIPVHGDGNQTRTFCYITDAINGFFRVLLKGKNGEAYNIGNERNEIPMRKLAEMYRDIIPSAKHSLIDYPETYPAGEPQRRCPDLRKAREHLGYRARVDLKEGLERFISWARKQKAYRDA
ncbi:MAG TPA: NAD-dependent epimerase/dehydratase family protein [Pyrinomonadaceae bacterium]|jgi:UDP-glucuronate decarboxylase|nr:NAD-dependent epimerase/dehydratase family protein [Pyrinomonadaceae bacterium]